MCPNAVSRPNSEGGCNGEHKGMKFNHWEGGHRVASFVGGPLLAPSLRGRWYNQTVHLVDLHATILDLARLYVHPCLIHFSRDCRCRR